MYQNPVSRRRATHPFEVQQLGQVEQVGIVGRVVDELHLRDTTATTGGDTKQQPVTPENHAGAVRRQAGQAASVL